MQHYVLQKAFQANFLAPIQHPATILDVGSGTGRWMVEVSQQFPRARLYGIDVDHPTMSFPKQCSFTQGNLLQGIPFPDGSFDFVHQRLLMLGLPLTHWPSTIDELRRVTVSGGWIELVECDLFFYPQGPATKQLMTWISTASQHRGIDIGVGKKIASFVQGSGLLNITERQIAIPLGHWGGRIGTMLLTDFSLAARETLKPFVVKTLSLDPQMYDNTVEQWIKECDSNQTSCDFTCVYAQKG
jgi:SAM-dependent methyltransferase